jgi:hypothetical protein
MTKNEILAVLRAYREHFRVLPTRAMMELNALAELEPDMELEPDVVVKRVEKAKAASPRSKR